MINFHYDEVIEHFGNERKMHNPQGSIAAFLCQSEE
jgi:hypothetical protein